MKEVLVSRHAKSSWSDESLGDHDRPLNKRGLRDAPRMASWLANQDLVPDLVLSSSANRARTTAEMYCEQWSSQAVIHPQIVDDFYLASPDVYIEYLQRLDPKWNRVMVVGHNPGLEMLVQQWVGVFEVMPTAAIAQIQFDATNWSAIGSENSAAKLAGVFRPKELFVHE